MLVATCRQGCRLSNMPRLYQRGFTLLELLMVSAVSAALLVSWSSFVTVNLFSMQEALHQSRQIQQFRQLGFWLSHELERSRDDGHWIWQQQGDCLLLSENTGVRVRQGQLQWRGGERDCDSSGWVSLSDAATFSITELLFEQQDNGADQLYMSALISGQPHQWRYVFSGKVYVHAISP